MQRSAIESQQIQEHTHTQGVSLRQMIASAPEHFAGKERELSCFQTLCTDLDGRYAFLGVEGLSEITLEVLLAKMKGGEACLKYLDEVVSLRDRIMWMWEKKEVLSDLLRERLCSVEAKEGETNLKNSKPFFYKGKMQVLREGAEGYELMSREGSEHVGNFECDSVSMPSVVGEKIYYRVVKNGMEDVVCKEDGSVFSMAPIGEVEGIHDIEGSLWITAGLGFISLYKGDTKMPFKPYHELSEPFLYRGKVCVMGTMGAGTYLQESDKKEIQENRLEIAWEGFWKIVDGEIYYVTRGSGSRNRKFVADMEGEIQKEYLIGDIQRFDKVAGEHYASLNVDGVCIVGGGGGLVTKNDKELERVDGFFEIMDQMIFIGVDPSGVTVRDKKNQILTEKYEEIYALHIEGDEFIVAGLLDGKVVEDKYCYNYGKQ
jgi:hypothetical protein